MRGRGTNSAHVFGAEAFHMDLREDAGQRSEHSSPVLNRSDLSGCRAHCQCTERPSGPGSVNAIVLVQTVSCQTAIRT